MPLIGKIPSSFRAILQTLVCGIWVVYAYMVTLVNCDSKISTMLDNCICGHEIIPGDSYCSQDTAMCELMPVLIEVHVSTHEEKIELKQPSFPLKPNLFCPLQYRLLSHIVTWVSFKGRWHIAPSLVHVYQYGLQVHCLPKNV